jgi:hypothetical protein
MAMQDVFPIDNDDQVHDVNASNDDDDNANDEWL